MESLRDSVLKIVGSKLRLLRVNPEAVEGLTDEDFKLVLSEVEVYILNYCNLKTVPIGLKYVWAGLAVDYILWMFSLHTAENDSEDGTIGIPSTVSSIREGDTTISFSADSPLGFAKAANGHNFSGVLDRHVLNYLDALRKYRKVVW